MFQEMRACLWDEVLRSSHVGAMSPLGGDPKGVPGSHAAIVDRLEFGGAGHIKARHSDREGLRVGCRVICRMRTREL
jgi:hypothetical protein